MDADREVVDLVLVMGTSLKVAPVADLLTYFPPSVPVVLINRTPVHHVAMDVMLLGDADDVVSYLSAELGWPLPRARRDVAAPERVGESHVWRFASADVGDEELAMYLPSQAEDDAKRVL